MTRFDLFVISPKKNSTKLFRSIVIEVIFYLDISQKKKINK